MKKAPISAVINHWLSQLQDKWKIISENVTEQTRNEITDVIDRIKGFVPNEPGIAFMVAYNNLPKFYGLVEGAEQGKYPLHTTVDMLSHYMRLGASINDQCRGHKTGYI